MSETEPPPPPPPPPPVDPPAGSGFDFGTALTWAWTKFRANAVTLVVTTLIIFAIVTALQLVGRQLSGLVFGAGDPLTYNQTTGEFTGGNSRGMFAGLAIGLFASVLAGFAQYLLQINFNRILLGIADGRTVTIGELFEFKRLGPSVILGLLLSIGSFLGFLLCIVPGVVFVFLTIFAALIFADTDAEPLAAVGSSVTMVTGNVGTFLLVALATIAITIVGVCACGIGLLVSIPVGSLFLTYAYRFHSNGAIAA